MANDNQTALMMSIQRKKDRVRIIKHQKERSDKLDWQNTSLTLILQGRIDELEFQITEDEKLLQTDKEQWIEAVMETYPHSLWNDKAKRKHAEELYNEKYGTDGK